MTFQVGEMLVYEFQHHFIEIEKLVDNLTFEKIVLLPSFIIRNRIPISRYLIIQLQINKTHTVKVFCSSTLQRLNYAAPPAGKREPAKGPNINYPGSPLQMRQRQVNN